MNEIQRIDRKVLLTLQDGAMYRFHFDILFRKTREDMAIKDAECLRLNVPNSVNIHTDSQKVYTKYESFLPESKIEIRMKKGFQQFLVKDSDFINVFLDKYVYPDTTFDYYLVYPRCIKDTFHAMMVVQNWSINFLNYHLNFRYYNPDLARNYSLFWGREYSMKNVKNNLRIEKIEFS